ncbi:ABC transporter permease [Actinoallomurus acanthiterrae]
MPGYPRIAPRATGDHAVDDAGWSPVTELRAALALWRRETTRYVRNRVHLTLTLLQPVLYLLIIGTGLSSLVRHTGRGDYRTFLFPGVLLLAVQIAAVGSAGSIVRDREGGFLREMLVAPVHRTTLLLGKCLGAATIAIGQGTAVLVLAPVAGVPYDPLLLATLIFEMAVLSLVLTALTALLAVTITDRDTFYATAGAIVLPMTFLSGMLFPTTRVPGWLLTLMIINPLLYMTDVLRRTIQAYLPANAAMPSTLPWHPPIVAELAVIAVVGLIALTQAARRFSRTA